MILEMEITSEVVRANPGYTFIIEYYLGLDLSKGWLDNCVSIVVLWDEKRKPEPISENEANRIKLYIDEKFASIPLNRELVIPPHFCVPYIGAGGHGEEVYIYIMKALNALDKKIVQHIHEATLKHRAKTEKRRH